MKRSDNIRLLLVCLGVIILVLGIAAKLVYLQVIRKDHFKRLADSQHTYVVELFGKRGDILSSAETILADTIPSYSLYGLPKKIRNKNKTAQALSGLLSLPKSDIVRKLSKDKSFVWIKRKLEKSLKDSIESMDLEGLGFLKEPQRFYPQGSLACHLLGLVDIDNNGLEGLELEFDRYLSARKGKAVLLRDSRGRALPLYRELVPARDGFDLVLNIDHHIQYWADFFLEKKVKATKAKGGSVVVLDPRNGKVISLSNYPAFDPNTFSGKSREALRNKAVTDFYEPGSVFKVVTLVAALAENQELESQKFFCEKGTYKIPGSVLHDWKAFGDLSFQEVFKNSSNIGVAKIANLVGHKTLYEYINKVDFGQPTGIDLPGETQGYVKPLSLWSKTSRFIIPIGQEVCVSPIQLARSFSVIANGGHLIKPYIVDKIVDKSGIVIKRFSPQISPKVISGEIADKARDILWQAVDEGTGRRAKIEGIKIAGKTGTSQKISAQGGYSHRDFYATFVGFFPVDDPRYLICVVVDEPRTYYYGGMVAAPLFKDIAEKIVEYKNL